MNRKQRRETSRHLGIMQYQSKLPLDKKLNLMRENIIAGKRMEAETAEEVRRSIEEQLGEKESLAIYSLAEHIAKNKGIPMIDAMHEAEIQVAAMSRK